MADPIKNRPTPIPLSDRQREIIDGEMLGDGFLHISTGSRNASLRWHLKSRAHCDVLASELSTLSPRIVPRRDVVGWKLDTRIHPELTLLRARWYRPHKRLPDDLILTPRACLHWFMGDGGVRGQPGCGLEIHTQGFSLPEVQRLGGMLTGLGIAARVHQRERNGTAGAWLTLERPYAEALLDYIGECPVADYAHKWERGTTPLKAPGAWTGIVCDPILF